MAADYWLAASPLDVDPDRHPHPWMPACGWRPDPLPSTGFTRNIVNMTVELSSFGRPKEEKLKPHLRPLREAATTTWSKHSLGHKLLAESFVKTHPYINIQVRQKAVELYSRKVPMGRLNVYVISCGQQDEILEVEKYHWQWRAVVGVVLKLGRMSRDVSNIPQHTRVPWHFHHRHCGSTEHQIRDYPRLQHFAQRGEPAPAAAAALVTGKPGRPQAQARVYELAREDAEQAENVTEGTVATKKCIPSLPVCIEDRGLFWCFFFLKMKDYDAILGLDWLEKHYALVDYRGKRITFRIPVEDEFSHPVPRNLAGRFVISAMKAMKMGRVEELLVAEELRNDHKKPFFFPFSSAATCTNHSLEVDQRFSGHCGLRIRTQNAFWFSFCDDGGECRILNATFSDVTFMLLLFGAVWLHTHSVARVGQQAGISGAKVTVYTVAFLFWPKATLASTSGRRGGVNVPTWTPILTQASSDVDVNLSDLHAQQSCCLLKQGMATHWGMSPNGSKALDLEIYCNKEEAEAKEKASPSFPRRGDHPGTRRKAILKALLQLLGTAQGDLSKRQGPWTPSSSLASIDHAADPESAARDRRLVILDRTVS
ncbi:hypothetical protein Taro_008449 [Colocasia esculenta]|uniref:Uncharacterized protein n=1 Tax=Colocasia esculenta TaxID=4460 RepID=A0A843TY93_COLES|nr:hypothetical protein [Colocasia esculenta]